MYLRGGEKTKGKLAFGLLVLFTVVLVSAGATSSGAQGVMAGVQAGNYFTYKVNSASSSSTLYGIDDFTETVTQVNETLGYHVVWYTELLHFSNGSKETNSGSVILENGGNMETTDTAQEGLFFSANLQVGDPITSVSTFRIDETLSVNGRPTNHASGDLNYSLSNTTTITDTYEYYIDQVTGAVVNETVSEAVTGQPTTSYSFSLIATNVWNVLPEFSPMALTLIMLLLTASAAIIVSRRKAKQPSYNPTTSKETKEAPNQGKTDHANGVPSFVAQSCAMRINYVWGEDLFYLSSFQNIVCF